MQAHRRLLSVLLALLALALVAAACGGDDDAAPESGDGTAAADDGADDAAVDAAGDSAGDGEASDGAAGDGEADGTDGTDGTDGADAVGDGAMEPVRGGTLTYGIISDGTGFDTLSGVGEGAIRIISALTDPLVAIDENGDWQPFLAEAITPNDDATVWTITLREGVKFHDGVPLDAEALKANWDALKASPNVGFFFAAVDEVRVVDGLTAEVVMNRPWGAFPQSLTGVPGWMLSPETIGQNDAFVSTGPFVLESWTPGDGAVTVRNTDYWLGPELPYLDSVVFKVIPEQAARRQALEAGDIQAYCCPGDADIIDFQGMDEIDIYINDGASNEILFLLNTTTAPTDDVRVRRAMAHAIDQQLIIDTYRSGLTTPAKSYIGPESRFWVDTDYPAYDPEAAQALVDEYEAEVGPIEITFNVTNIASATEVAELVLSFLADVGIDAEINPIQAGTEVPLVISDNFQVQFWAQFSGYDPDADYVFFHSSGGALNWSNLVDPELDAALDVGRESLDLDERAEAYARVQQVFADQVPILWIDHLSGVEGVAADPSVHDIIGRALPDGTPLVDFLGGSFFSFAQVWIG